MITGYVCAILLLLLLLSYVTGRIKNKRWNRLMKKIHKPCGYLLLIMGVVHLIVTIPLWGQRKLSLMLSGGILLIIAVLIAVTYMLHSRFQKKWIGWHRLGAAFGLLLLVFHVITYFIGFGEYQKKAEKIQIEGVSAANVADGVYNGSCDIGYIRATIQVTVHDQKITDIAILEHKNERGKKAESILSSVLSEQSTDVDTVSGATRSSKVILEAIENALSQGRGK